MFKNIKNIKKKRYAVEDGTYYTLVTKNGFHTSAVYGCLIFEAKELILVDTEFMSFRHNRETYTFAVKDVKVLHEDF